ncbi:MAG: MFS transporter [Hyphomicrobiales bacterium]|nr:MFS transporter [Hyphomicrobiales bacterium]
MIENPQRTHWARILALFLAGIAVSFLVGKAPTALPLLRNELDLSLFQAGLVISIYSLVSGTLGLFCGMLADRAGQRRIGLFGMALAAAASLAGAFSEGPLLLLSTRALEGLGFFLTVVSMPALLLRAARLSDMRRVMGLWSGYMPTGMGLMMLTGGLLLDSLGWRGVWLVNAALVAAVAVLVLVAAAPLSRPPVRREPLPPLRAITEVCRPGPLLLALAFGSYGAQFLIVTAFVPLILVENAGWSPAAAGTAGAFVIIANIVGCFSAGSLLDSGRSRAAIVITVAAIMAACAIVVMGGFAPIAIRLIAAALLSAFGGLIPGVLFSGVPVHAPSPLHIASVNGLMLQGVALGQLIGPALTSFVVDLSGSWAGALAVLLPLAAATMLAGTGLGRLERRTG